MDWPTGTLLCSAIPGNDGIRSGMGRTDVMEAGRTSNCSDSESSMEFSPALAGDAPVVRVHSVPPARIRMNLGRVPVNQAIRICSLKPIAYDEAR